MMGFLQGFRAYHLVDWLNQTQQHQYTTPQWWLWNRLALPAKQVSVHAQLGVELNEAV